MEERMTQVEGLPRLLRSSAEMLHGDVNGLNKELLYQSAAKLDELEEVARVASEILERIPRKGKGSFESKVPRPKLIELANALRAAGKGVKALRM